MERYVNDPLILPKSAWSADIPEWLIVQIKLERLEKEGAATDAEALAYIFPLSLEAPLDHDFAEIYFYLATAVFKRIGKEVPAEIKVEQLSEYRMSELNHLKHDIYEKRVKARKKNVRIKKDPA